MRILCLMVAVAVLTGCLKTRDELKSTSPQSGAMRTDASGTYVTGAVGQQQRAQIDSRFFEIDRDFRQLYGKIETLEKNLEDVKTQPQTATAGPTTGESAKKIMALEKRVATLEEALLAIDKKMQGISKGKASARVSQPTPKPKGPFGRGEILYKQGKYEQAIAAYDQYRKKFPRGRRYAQATLKMGLCFQKLNMNQDAKAFYKEVIQRYPKTKVSIRAQKNLKSI